jgi:hypothetical protein
MISLVPRVVHVAVSYFTVIHASPSREAVVVLLLLSPLAVLFGFVVFGHVLFVGRWVEVVGCEREGEGVGGVSKCWKDKM